MTEILLINHNTAQSITDLVLKTARRFASKGTTLRAVTGTFGPRYIASRVGYERSNGCAYADSAGHVPIQRMANVSLQPANGGPSTAELSAGVDDGLYIVGDKSWSIDMQRYNVQFTGQRFFQIKDGRLNGQVKDVAYQATTTDFWGSMASVGRL